MYNIYYRDILIYDFRNVYTVIVFAYAKNCSSYYLDGTVTSYNIFFHMRTHII